MIRPDRITKCPAKGCDFHADADDLGAQVEHMTEECERHDEPHLAVMRARLTEAEMAEMLNGKRR